MLLVILDGAGDRENKELKGKTPLEAAVMPNLNSVAVHGLAGMMYPIRKGVAPESDAAVFSILGYSTSNYTGRGPLEAYGAGIHITRRSLAFRTNFATINQKMEIVDRRAGRNVLPQEAKELERAINKIRLPGATIRFKATIGHRGVLVINSRKIKLSSNISNADVGYIKRGNISVAKSRISNKFKFVMPLDNTSSSRETTELVNAFLRESMKVLKDTKVNNERRKKGLPEANALLLRDAGIGLPKVMPIKKKFGISAAFIAEMPVEKGIAKLLGMRQLIVRSRGGTEYYHKLAVIVKNNISKYDLIYVHIKGPDEPGHDGNARLKTEILKQIDSEFFSKVKNIANVTCVTADHSTPCVLKAHSADPVPVVIYCKNGLDSSGDNLRFDERIRSRGSLGIFTGHNLINKIISVLYGCNKVNRA